VVREVTQSPLSLFTIEGSLNELVINERNGLVFHNSDELATHLTVSFLFQ
jgi:hypothetical protein